MASHVACSVITLASQLVQSQAPFFHFGQDHIRQGATGDAVRAPNKPKKFFPNVRGRIHKFDDDRHLLLVAGIRRLIRQDGKEWGLPNFFQQLIEHHVTTAIDELILDRGRAVSGLPAPNTWDQVEVARATDVSPALTRKRRSARKFLELESGSSSAAGFQFSERCPLKVMFCQAQRSITLIIDLSFWRFSQASCSWWVPICC